MEHPQGSHQTNSGKPYDIRERMFLFACDVVRIAQELHRRGRIAGELSIQLVNALRATGYLTEQGDLVIQESRELVKIVATIIRNSEARDVHRR
jgi:hypothetical protein